MTRFRVFLLRKLGPPPMNLLVEWMEAAGLLALYADPPTDPSTDPDGEWWTRVPKEED